MLGLKYFVAQTSLGHTYQLARLIFISFIAHTNIKMGYFQIKNFITDLTSSPYAALQRRLADRRCEAAKPRESLRMLAEVRSI